MYFRILFENKITSSEILTILSIILPIPLSFIKDGEFDIKDLTTAIPYLIFFAIVIFTCYFAFRNFIEIKKMFKGEDGMIERLKEIFSELYIECVNDEKQTKVIAKKKVKKTKKEHLEGRQNSKNKLKILNIFSFRE